MKDEMKDRREKWVEGENHRSTFHENPNFNFSIRQLISMLD